MSDWEKVKDLAILTFNVKVHGSLHAFCLSWMSVVGSNILFSFSNDKCVGCKA